MLAPSRGRIALERASSVLSAATTSSSPSATIPSFLVPAFQTSSTPKSFSRIPRRSVPSSIPASAATRAFSTTSPMASKIGRSPISIPPGVEVTISDPWVKKDATSYLKLVKRTMTVKGPLGELSLDVPDFINFNHDAEERKMMLSVVDKSLKQQKEMWGTVWAYLNGYIIGVSEGHTAILRLVGVGYRATVEERPEKAAFEGQKFVCLKLGFTHPVEEPVPRGMTAATPQPTRILLEGIDREVVMALAAKIRDWRRPEPYKGKGIFINDETIKLKQKKIK